MKKYLIIPLAAALLLGCSKEQVFEPLTDEGELIPLNIDGSIAQVATKATAQGFVNGDAVGLYAVNYNEGNTVAGILQTSGNQADNVKYVFDEAAFKWTPMRPVYYKDVNTNVDLYVYYPYQAGVTDVQASGFEVQKDQSASATTGTLSSYEASDWLWGKAVDITPSESKVKIPLSHRLSAVQVALVEGSGFGEDEFASLGKSIILTNTTRKATLNFRTGEAVPVGQPQLDGIVMCPQEGGAFRAIVIPQSVAAGTQLFAITLNGISYSFSQGEIVTYQAGKQLNVSITLNKKTPTGDYELVLGSTTIVDWTEDRNSHGGEARQYFVVNVETPGTLGETITAAGKNPAKIRNLKVTGNINKNDFDYMREQMAILEAVNLKESVLRCSGGVIATAYKWDGDYESYYVARYGTPDYDDGAYCEWYDKRDHVIPQDAFSGKSSLYFFVFPESVIEIGDRAFSGSNISGALIIPEGTVVIGSAAFADCKLLSSLSLPGSLERIGGSAFSGDKGITGTLSFPESLTVIGDSAFSECSGFTGPLILPHNLEELGGSAFNGCGGFTGDLSIPDRITILHGSTFCYCSGLRGHLYLNNVTSLEASWFSVFCGCKFQGELVIPEGVVELNSMDSNWLDGMFSENDFTSVVLPSTLKKIGSHTFQSCSKLIKVTIPEGLLQIGDEAFADCGHLEEITLPSSLVSIGSGAFRGCFNLSRIVSKPTQVPNTLNGAFDGVGKDNLTVEVPDISVARYQASPVWCEFKRISGHRDFSVSRRLMRALNGELTRTLTLRAPAGFNWSIQEKPDWVTVTPASGNGKTEVTITISEMAAGDVGTFEVNEGSFLDPYYRYYAGRGGDVVFLLEGENYTTAITIEQYDYQYPDGYVKQYRAATVGNGIDIVITGDGYDAKDIADGIFIDNSDEAVQHFFDVEPYKTYKDYFNVYAVVAMSPESGIGTLNTVIDNKFGTYFTQNRLLPPAPEPCFAWARKADNDIDFTKSLVILLQNTSNYEGVCMMYGDGSAIACCPVSRDDYPYDFRGIIQHEAGGHGFGKLADEYVYHNAFIQTCNCQDGCDHGEVFSIMKARGWYQNLSLSGSVDTVPWGHLIYNPQFSNYVDMYEGGYMHARGVYRSEPTSCMNNNIPYYSAISRQAIVERIMDYAGLQFLFEDFCAYDTNAFGTITKSKSPELFDRSFGVDPNFTRGSEQGSVIYMGEHPDYSKI